MYEACDKTYDAKACYFTYYPIMKAHWHKT